VDGIYSNRPGLLKATINKSLLAGRE